MYKRIALTVFSAAFLASTAFAQFTTTNAGPLNSVDAQGTAGNGTISSTYTGPNRIYTSFNFSGQLTEVITSTWLSDSAFSIRQTTALGGLAAFNEFIPSPLGEDFTGTVSVNSSLNGLFWFNNSAQYTFEAYERTDDGPGTDATWSNLNFNFNNALSATSIGTFQVGSSFTFSTAGSIVDTELAVYDANTGALIGTNDDDGLNDFSLLNLGALPAGQYNLVLGGFNSTFEEGLALPGRASGDFTIALNNSPISSGTLAQDQFHVLNFTVTSNSVIPEPGSLSLLGLIALPGLAVLRRRK